MEPAQYGSSASTEPQLQVHAGLTLPLEGQERNGGKRARRAAVIRMVGALVCIIGAIAAWITMAEKLQKLDQEYKKPYFISYFVHSSYSLLYVAWALWRYFPYCLPVTFWWNQVGDGALNKFKPLGIWSGVLSAVSIVSAYSWNLSLTRTNIPANTAIYQCAFAVVFVISVPLLKERVTLLKVLCVVASIPGVFLVAFFSDQNKTCLPDNVTNATNASDLIYNDHDFADSPTDSPCEPDPETSTPLGYVLLMVSVLTYAIFETFYKKFGTKKDDPASTLNGLRFLGYIGVHNLLWLWPPIIILHFTGVEPFEIPPSMELFGMLVLNSFLDIVFNGCLLVCIALSSPLFATVGTIMAVPVSVVVDWIFQHFLLSWQSFVGIALIIIGFTGFLISEFVQIRRENNHNKQSSKKLQVTAGSNSNSSSSNESLKEKEPLLDEKKTQDSPVQNRNWKSKLVLYLI